MADDAMPNPLHGIDRLSRWNGIEIVEVPAQSHPDFALMAARYGWDVAAGRFPKTLRMPKAPPDSRADG